MMKNLLLFLTDEDIRLYEGSNERIYPLQGGIELVQKELKKLLSITPRTPINLLIDRNFQEVRQEELPPLLPWDRLRLLSYKREFWISQGGYYGYQILKQEGKTYLQWINISKSDPLISWILWMKTLSNPLGRVFFLSIDASSFLQKHLPSIGGKEIDYQMLIYELSPHKRRHFIFKGGRLLLSRFFQSEEDIRSSLHFLSRSHQNIHEKVQVLSLSNGFSLTLPHPTFLADPKILTNFFMSHKQTSLILSFSPRLSYVWIKRGVGLLLLSSICFAGIAVHKGLDYKNEARILMSKINTLKIKIYNRKFLLKDKDIQGFRLALEHYNYIKFQFKDPFKILETLAIVLKKHQVQLEKLIWVCEEKVAIELTFSMQNYDGNKLSKQFTAFLSSLAEEFPNSQIHIIGGPFKSSSHETYSYPPEPSTPLAQIRIDFQ